MLSTTDKAFSENACSGSSKGGGGAFLALKKNKKSQFKKISSIKIKPLSYFLCAVHVIFEVFKLVSNFGCLFTFCFSAWTNLLETKLQTCNLQTGLAISYKYVNQF